MFLCEPSIATLLVPITMSRVSHCFSSSKPFSDCWTHFMFEFMFIPGSIHGFEVLQMLSHSIKTFIKLDVPLSCRQAASMFQGAGERMTKELTQCCATRFSLLVMWLVSRPCWFSDVGVFDFSVFPSGVFHSIILRSEEGSFGAHSLLCWFLLQSRRWLRRHVKQSVQKFLTNAHATWGNCPEVPDACIHFGVFGVDSQSRS